MSDAMKLPPLPGLAVCGIAEFTADQMRAYGEQCARAAVAAERGCHNESNDTGQLVYISDDLVDKIAAIRARTTP